MDWETGERFCDSETGESPAKPQLNSETGETEINCIPPTPTKKTFKIPNNYIKRPHVEEERVTQNILTRKEVKNEMSPIIVFLLPTIFFVPIVGIILGTAEVLLHIWCHKKNKLLVNKGVYYQSPLHVFVSQFCACCRDETMKNKISKIQDKRHYKLTKNSAEYFRRVVT